MLWLVVILTYFCTVQFVQADECARQRAAARGEGEEQGQQDASQAGAGASCSHCRYLRTFFIFLYPGSQLTRCGKFVRFCDTHR